MLTQGLDHVAVITNDSDRFQSFYIDMFGATVESDGEEFPGGPRMTVINIGPATELNVFEIDGNQQAGRQTPMFGRGRRWTTSASTRPRRWNKQLMSRRGGCARRRL